VVHQGAENHRELFKRSWVAVTETVYQFIYPNLKVTQFGEHNLVLNFNACTLECSWVLIDGVPVFRASGDGVGVKPDKKRVHFVCHEAAGSKDSTIFKLILRTVSP